MRALQFVQNLLVLTAILVLEGPGGVCGYKPVGPRVAVKLHLHVIEIVEDGRGLLHPPSGGSRRKACRCGAENVPVSSY